MRMNVYVHTIFCKIGIRVCKEFETEHTGRMSVNSGGGMISQNRT
jgi:hypothetical protein